MSRWILASLLLTAPAWPQVVGFDVDVRGPAAAGRTFGEVGTYERIEGRVRLALDPRSPFNRRIVDLDLAPRDADGRVAADADVVVLQPVDPARRRGTALIEVCNRGGRAALSYFCRGQSRLDVASHFGDGLLMRLGLTVVWVGWQQDVPRRDGLLRLRGPVLRAPDGTPIEGPVRADWTVEADTTRLALGHRDHVPFPVVEPGADHHVLTRRPGRDAPREVVPRASWRFTDDGTAIEGSFAAGYVHELVYRARDPVVTGLGLAAVRDVASWLENDPDCPCRVERTIAVGISQTGRFLRHFLWQGFETDTAGRPTLDGVLALTAGAGRGSFNHRFAQPSRDAHAYSAFYFPTDLFPFTSRTQHDPVTGRTDGLFAHAHDPAHLPAVFWVNTGYEYWGRAAALIHTSVDGTRDVEPTGRERIYHVASAQHYPGRAEDNPIDLRAVYRGLLVAMLEQVDDGVEPPASQFPHLGDRELVPIQRFLRAHPIPGVVWPTRPHTAHRVDYGPAFWSDGIVDLEPPRLGPAFPALVPAVDAFGNEIGGLRPLEVRVPAGTFLPARLKSVRAGWPSVVDDFVGRFVPLAADASARRETGDPRPSAAQLYASAQAYEARVRQEAERMVRERFLLAEDLERAVMHTVRLYLASATPR